jgi:zinc transport system substrate-binding protein
MKKVLVLCLTCLLFLCGCLKRDTMEDITIYTSYYPLEYITNALYGNNSKVYSIYPDGTNPNDTTLTEKQLSDYSNGSLFIFSGLSNEKNYLYDMLKNNKDLKIIDSTLSMQTNEEYGNRIEELWLDPNNLLMIARNIKDGLDEYINNYYLKNEIENNYSNLKIELSQMSANLHLIAETADNPTLVVSSDVFKFLENYGFTIYSLEKNDEKTIKIVSNLMKNKKINYIFLLSSDEETETIKKLNETYGTKLVIFNSLATISVDDRNDKKDYLSIMKENINLIKQEVFE